MISYNLDWHKNGAENKKNTLKVLGLFDFCNTNSLFFSDNHNPFETKLTYGNSNFYGSLAQSTENALARFIASQFNPTNFNSLDLMVTDSIEKSLEVLKLYDIELFLIQTLPFIESPRRPNSDYKLGKTIINIINSAITSGFDGKTIVISTDNNSFLLSECKKNRITIIDENQHYSVNLKKELQKYFTQ